MTRFVWIDWDLTSAGAPTNFYLDVVCRFMNLSEVAYTVADESQVPASFATLLKKFTKFDYEVSSTVSRSILHSRNRSR